MVRNEPKIEELLGGFILLAIVGGRVIAFCEEVLIPFICLLLLITITSALLILLFILPISSIFPAGASIAPQGYSLLLPYALDLL